MDDLLELEEGSTYPYNKGSLTTGQNQGSDGRKGIHEGKAECFLNRLSNSVSLGEGRGETGYIQEMARPQRG